jgi:hypothetical protein
MPVSLTTSTLVVENFFFRFGYPLFIVSWGKN